MPCLASMTQIPPARAGRRPPQCWNEDARGCGWSLGASAALGGSTPSKVLPPAAGCHGHPCSRGELLPGRLAGGSGAAGGRWSRVPMLLAKMALPFLAGRLGAVPLPWGLLRLFPPAGGREDGSWQAGAAQHPFPRPRIGPPPSNQASHLGDPLPSHLFLTFFAFNLGQASPRLSHRLPLVPRGSDQPHRAAGEEELWRWERLEHSGETSGAGFVVSAPSCQPWLSQPPRLFC